MSRFKLPTILLVLVGHVLCSGVMQADDQPYPIEDWAKRSDISRVSLSPDGNRLALLKIPTDDGMPILEIFDANDLSQVRAALQAAKKFKRLLKGGNALKLPGQRRHTMDTAHLPELFGKALEFRVIESDPW